LYVRADVINDSIKTVINGVIILEFITASIL